MSTQNPPAMPVGLAVGATCRAAFGTVFRNFGAFLQAAIVPLLLSLAILVADFAFRALVAVGGIVLDPDGLGAVLAELGIGVVAMLPFTFLGISVTRRNLLGPQRGLLPSPLLGRRTLVYTGYLLLLTVVFVVVAALAAFAGIALFQVVDQAVDLGAGPMIVGGIAMFSLLLYLLLRFSLVLPAVALDEKLGLLGSWRLTRRSGLRLLGVFLLVFLVLILAILIGSVIVGGGQVRLGTPELLMPEGTGAGSDWIAIVLANLPGNTWNLVANVVFFAMSCGAMASAYAQLRGWSGPRDEILERFE